MCARRSASFARVGGDFWYCCCLSHVWDSRVSPSTHFPTLTHPPDHSHTHTDENADILILGSRGMSALKKAFVGSVSEYCVHHVACPVIVVRNKREGERVISEATVLEAEPSGGITTSAAASKRAQEAQVAGGTFNVRED